MEIGFDSCFICMYEITAIPFEQIFNCMQLVLVGEAVPYMMQKNPALTTRGSDYLLWSVIKLATVHKDLY